MKREGQCRAERTFPSFRFPFVEGNKHKQSTPALKHGKLSPLNRLADSAFRFAARIGCLASCHHVSTQPGSRSPADKHKEKVLLCAQHPSLFLLYTCTHFSLKSRRRAEARHDKLSEDSLCLLLHEVERGVVALPLRSPGRSQQVLKAKIIFDSASTAVPRLE